MKGVFLNIVVEGSTEENFINQILKPYLAERHIWVNARQLETGWDRLHNKPAKGGLLKFPKFRADLLNWIAEGKHRKDKVYYSSLLDLYAFPIDDQSPYTEEIRSIADPYAKVARLEDAISKNINSPVFIPFVQLHEFEAMLFTDINCLNSLYPDKAGAVNRLARSVQGLPPEEINEKPQTAPSKRIISYLPEYEAGKNADGPLAVMEIGLDRVRQACPHFDEWLKKLESLTENL
ncbi:MAG: DUF4276 family protein [Bacteroidota bacterium]